MNFDLSQFYTSRQAAEFVGKPYVSFMASYPDQKIEPLRMFNQLFFSKDCPRLAAWRQRNLDRLESGKVKRGSFEHFQTGRCDE